MVWRGHLLIQGHATWGMGKKGKGVKLLSIRWKSGEAKRYFNWNLFKLPPEWGWGGDEGVTSVGTLRGRKSMDSGDVILEELKWL